MSEETPPDCEIVKREGKYVLYENGAMWTTGEHAYLCGYVSNPDHMLFAIDTHEEEMRVLVAQAREEFGL